MAANTIRFPGESARYRQARDDLLSMEIELRLQVERIAARRRALPQGGPLKQDYVFDERPTLAPDAPLTRVAFSDLFQPHRDSLLVYSFMYAPGAAAPCAMCTAFLDSLNGNAPHVAECANLVVVAKAPIDKICDWARRRGWTKLRLLSSQGNSYNADYFGERNGRQMPMLNVFRRTATGIAHSYGTEMLYVPAEPGQNSRHVDMVWPLWNLLDLTPEGRGTEWYPEARI